MLRVTREGPVMSYGYLEVGEGNQTKEVKPSGLFRSPWGLVLLVRAQQDPSTGWESKQGTKGNSLEYQPGTWPSKLGTDRGGKIIQGWCGQGAWHWGPGEKMSRGRGPKSLRAGLRCHAAPSDTWGILEVRLWCG